MSTTRPRTTTPTTTAAIAPADRSHPELRARRARHLTLGATVAVAGLLGSVGLAGAGTPSLRADLHDAGLALARRTAAAAPTTAPPAPATELAPGTPTGPAPAEADVHRTTPTVEGDGTCRGLPADVVGPGEEYVGTSGNDVIVVYGPAEVWANGGDDLVCVHGDPASAYHVSTVYGGPGNDVVVGLSGSLDAYGNDGDDVLIGNGQSMAFEGGDGQTS